MKSETTIQTTGNTGFAGPFWFPSKNQVRQKQQKRIPQEICQCNGGHWFCGKPKKHHKSARFRFSNRQDVLVLQSNKALRKCDFEPSEPGVGEEHRLSSSNEFGAKKFIKIFLSKAIKMGSQTIDRPKKKTPRGQKANKHHTLYFWDGLSVISLFPVCTLNPVLLSPYSPPPLLYLYSFQHLFFLSRLHKCILFGILCKVNQNFWALDPIFLEHSRWWEQLGVFLA